ncbi:MAG: pyruvate ferredoxin oxidoreductase [candidate division WOR-3 bacterium]
MIVAKTGNEAMAYAMKQINPDVVAAYPITPSTEIVQIFSSYVADGLVDTEYVAVESEHSAMSACIGAAAAGARAMTATASQGLALMHEMLFIASGLRLPIVMCVASRSLSSPLNIHCDHSDSVASRDSGWIQIFCENSQEGYDSVIQAVKIAESCYLPVIVAIDGFILSHCMDRIEVLDDDQVQKFVGKLKPNYSLLDVDNPITVSPACLPDSYFEHKRAQAQGMIEALPVIEKVIADFAQKFGRNYPVLEGYRTDDAEAVVLAMGSTVGTARIAVDNLRREGKQVGMVKLRVFRPLVHQRIKDFLGKFKVVGVLDRVESVNSYVSPLTNEIRSALYPAGQIQNCHKPLVPSYVYGLGGREITPEDIMNVLDELLTMAKTGKMKDEVTYVGVRE